MNAESSSWRRFFSGRPRTWTAFLALTAVVLGLFATTSAQASVPTAAKASVAAPVSQVPTAVAASSVPAVDVMSLQMLNRISNFSYVHAVRVRGYNGGTVPIGAIRDGASRIWFCGMPFTPFNTVGIPKVVGKSGRFTDRNFLRMSAILDKYRPRNVVEGVAMYITYVELSKTQYEFEKHRSYYVQQLRKDGVNMDAVNRKVKQYKAVKPVGDLSLSMTIDTNQRTFTVTAKYGKQKANVKVCTNANVGRKCKKTGSDGKATFKFSGLNGKVLRASATGSSRTMTIIDAPEMYQFMVSKGVKQKASVKRTATSKAAVTAQVECVEGCEGEARFEAQYCANGSKFFAKLNGKTIDTVVVKRGCKTRAYNGKDADVMTFTSCDVKKNGKCKRKPKPVGPRLEAVCTPWAEATLCINGKCTEQSTDSVKFWVPEDTVRYFDGEVLINDVIVGTWQLSKGWQTIDLERKLAPENRVTMRFSSYQSPDRSGLLASEELVSVTVN